MKIDIPGNVQAIIKKLTNEGFEASVYGSCIRDTLLGRPVLTWDILTSALPPEIVSLFDEKEGYKAIPALRDYTSVNVIYRGESYRVSSYRSGEEHRFADIIDDALIHNDFTMNSIAYNEARGFIDPYNGIDDLRAKCIKCVGEGSANLQEDPVRILRAVRFEAELGFTICESLLNDIRSLSHTVVAADPEKLCNEFTQILLVDKPSFVINRLLELGLLGYLIPELIPTVGFDTHSSYHDKDVFTHSLMVMDNTHANLSLRLAALLHDIGKTSCLTIDENGEGHCYGHASIGSELASVILGRLNFDNKTINTVCALVKEHMNDYDNISELGLKRLIRRVGPDNVGSLFALQIADIKGSELSGRSIAQIRSVRNKCFEVLSRREPLSTHDLDINGYELMGLGYAPGRDIGEALDYLLDIVAANPSLNQKETLIKLLRER
ncbi:CCA tRNA nucleotidyltransferase [Syntrophomonas palmitatica]|uniref:CCA tRNA nucleotidyltransferase n=1 Tax=Syntrophomonas palmitatica TaxID=402877 RepID=UPI0006D1DD92|nr:HD domain-containing protein [Syntrophomonas palmitatica]